MRKLSLILCLLLTTATFAAVQEAQSPYAGQEERAIKALSLEEIRQYLTGAGMGFAKAAELNHFPGPKHVIEWAEQLLLSQIQLKETKKIRAAMQKEAVRLGKLLVEKEKALDDLFANASINKEKLNAMVEEIAQLSGRIRAAHLRAHLKMKELLSEHQVMLYDQLRGYDSGHSHQEHKQH